MRKGIFLAAIVFLALAAFPGISQSYLQYVNEEWGFKISYPVGWTIEEEEDYIAFYAPYEDTWDTFNENVVVTVEELPYPMSLEDYLNEALPGLQSMVEDFTLLGIYDDTISGKPAKIIAYAGSIYGYYLVFSQVAVIEGKRAYVLTFTAEPDKVDLYADTFDKILYSFTLITEKPKPKPPIRPPIKPPVGGKGEEEEAGGEEKPPVKPPVKPPIKPPVGGKGEEKETGGEEKPPVVAEETGKLAPQPPSSRVKLRYSEVRKKGDEVVEEGTLYVIIEPLQDGKLRVTTFSTAGVKEVVVGADWIEYVDGEPGEEIHPLFWNPGKTEIGGLSFKAETTEEGVLKLVYKSDTEEMEFVFDKDGILTSYRECGESGCYELKLVKRE